MAVFGCQKIHKHQQRLQVHCGLIFARINFRDVSQFSPFPRNLILIKKLRKRPIILGDKVGRSPVLEIGSITIVTGHVGERGGY